jgi:hypothetical protein
VTLAAVTLGDLVELVWVSLVVSLVLVTTFAFGIRLSARAGDLRRAGQGGGAAASAAGAVLCYALVGAGMVAGILVIAAG